ncbi:MAG: LptA/OstA family protein [Candidatus Aerophobetes bacterium]|nr:LptA/OstA family protein [Candidatus Aerophobetes bacterium]
MRKGVFFLFIGLIIVGGISFAEASSNQRQLVINSSRQEMNYKSRIFIYEGDVEATWKDFLIKGDRLEMYLTKEDAISKVIIKGKVRITQMTDKGEKREATCELATYTAQDDRVILEGKAHYLDEMGNDILANKITIWVTLEKLVAEGSPVKAIYSLKGEEEVGPASGESH